MQPAGEQVAQGRKDSGIVGRLQFLLRHLVGGAGLAGKAVILALDLLRADGIQGLADKEFHIILLALQRLDLPGGGIGLGLHRGNLILDGFKPAAQIVHAVPGQKGLQVLQYLQ